MGAPGGRTRAAIVAFSLLAAGICLGAALLREVPLFGGGWTDGVTLVLDAGERPARRVRWRAPEPLEPAEPIGLPLLEPCFEQGSRALLFAAGVPGRNVDLYVGLLADGRIEEVRPLAGVNSPFDDRAPSLEEGTLVFASDRPGGAGRLDLYRAAWNGGSPASPVAIAEANGPFEETDPAIRPKGGGVLFASDRAGGFDLYFLEPQGGGGATPHLLPELSSPSEDRAPAFRSDGRAVVLSSDRDGTFDLFLSWFDPTRDWTAPVPLELFSGPLDETDPALSPEGFSLLLARSHPEHPEETGLALARSSELLRASPGFSTLELLALGALLLLVALLALLGRRWRALDLLSKCLLLSILLHLLLLLLSKKVRVESRIEEPPARSPTYRVRILPDEQAIARSKARGERVEQDRGEAPAQRASPEASEAAPAPVEDISRDLPSPETPSAIVQAPAPAPSGPEDRADPAQESVSLRDRDPAATERRGGLAAPLRLAESATRVEPSAGGRGERFAGAQPSSEPASPAPADRSIPLRGERIVAAQPRLGEPGPSAPAVDAPKVAAGEALPARAAPSGAPTLAIEARSQAGSPETASPPNRWFSEGGSSPASLAPRRIAVGNDQRAGPDVALGSVRPPAVSAPGERSEAEVSSPSLREPAPAEATNAGRAGLALPALALEAQSGTGPAGPERTPDRWLPDGRSTPSSLAPGPIALGGDQGGARDVGLAEVRAPALESPGRRGEIGIVSPTLRVSGASEPTRGEKTVAALPGLALEARKETGTPGTGHSPTRWFSEGSPTASALGPEPIALGSEPGKARDLGLGEIRAAAVQAAGQRVETEIPSPSLRAPAAADAPADGNKGAPAAGLALEARSFAGPVETRADSPPRPSIAPGGGERLAPGSLDLAIPWPAPPAAPPTTELTGTPYERRSGLPKEVALREFGGTPETEKAVAQGLRYLASIQGRDGSWGDLEDRDSKYRDVRVGKTGLALLAFLAAGHTHVSESEHEAVVQRALRFLLGRQHPETGHFGQSEGYGHGICAYAFAEAYAMTKDEDLRGPLERAIGRILEGQETRRDPRFFGGWSYYYPDDSRFDEWPRASITAWQVMALESARLGGIEVPDDAFAAARAYLLRSFDEEHDYFRYSHDPQRLSSGYRTLPGSTPASVFALGLLGAGDDPRVASAIPFIRDRRPRRFQVRSEERFVTHGEGNIYFWYYGTLAFFQRGGALWNEWNEAMKATLLPAQEADGSWTPIDPYARIAGDDSADRSYTTAVCVLMLEVYYRYVTPLLRWHPSMPGVERPVPTPASGRRPI
ncbi:MAG: hypothetical protein L0323_14470 [Planctomycetes bacterium]|nr:hypothetical protein [Planctomycetota bacterium]